MQRTFQFYIVPTPIGNLDDITLRAIEVLKSVDLVACEDTRTTQNLLNHYNIKTKTCSYHKFNEKSMVDDIVTRIKSGKKIALVSDAGTPLICDPGSILMKELLANNIDVTSLPGACAISTFLSHVPRDNELYTFVGFLPRTEQKASELINKYYDTNLVFYESPNRILKTLELIKSLRGTIKIAVGRELSKLYEEVIIDSAENLIKHFSSGVKGEFVCMIYAEEDKNFDIQQKVSLLKSKGFKSKEIATILSTLFDINKNDVYKIAME